MATNAATLYWKLEDVPVGDGEAQHPEDIGPTETWIDFKVIFEQVFVP